MERSSFQLEACEEGSSQFNEGACPWEADGLCYSTKEEACACVCPDDVDSTCISGLYGGEDGMVHVFCD